MRTGGFVLAAMLAVGLFAVGCSDSQPGELAAPVPSRNHSTGHDPVRCAEFCDQIYSTCGGSADSLLGGDESQCFLQCEAGEIDYDTGAILNGTCDQVVTAIFGTNDAPCIDPLRCTGEAHAIFGE
jgi:hypothetical protein